MIGPKSKYYILTSLLFFATLIKLFANSPVYNDNRLILSDSLILKFNYNRLIEIYPDTFIILYKVNDLSDWHFRDGNLYFINSGYMCKFSFLTHKLDTLAYSVNVRSFTIAPDALYYLNDIGIWKNDILLINGKINSFEIWKYNSILFLRNDTLYMDYIASTRDSIIDIQIKAFYVDELGHMVLLKNDSLFANNQFLSTFKYNPDKFYAIGNRIFIYAKDSIYSFIY